MSNMRHLMLFH